MADIIVRTFLEQTRGSGHDDITTRTRSVTARIGRGGSGHTRFAAGVCTIVASPDDDWLSPIGDGTVTAQDVMGNRVVVTARIAGEPRSAARSLFAGYVDEISWDFDGGTVHVSILALDDIAFFADKQISLTGMPDELTGARLRRLMTAAGFSASSMADIPDGTVTCVTPEAEGAALPLFQEIADTEGGWLWASHGQLFDDVKTAYAAGESLQISLSARDQSPGEADLSVVDGQASIANVSTADSIFTELLSNLLVTRVQLELSGTGDENTEPTVVERTSSTAVVERYGDHPVKRVVVCNETAAEDLGDWMVSTFAEPLLHVRSLKVLAHLETDTAARKLLQSTVGHTVEVQQHLPSGSMVTTEHLVEQQRWTVHPWNMRQGRCAVTLTLNLWPTGTVQSWTLGTSALGVNTRLGPADSETLRIDTPGGDVSWDDGDTVSAIKFGAGITAQVVTRYDSFDDLVVAEGEVPVGLLAATGDGCLWTKRSEGWRLLACIEGL